MESLHSAMSRGIFTASSMPRRNVMSFGRVREIASFIPALTTAGVISAETETGKSACTRNDSAPAVKTAAADRKKRIDPKPKNFFMALIGIWDYIYVYFILSEEICIVMKHELNDCLMRQSGR